jgi:hypothetical protein
MDSSSSPDFPVADIRLTLSDRLTHSPEVVAAPRLCRLVRVAFDRRSAGPTARISFLSNTPRARPVLSSSPWLYCSRGKGLAYFPRNEINAALHRVRYHHPALQI